VFVTEFPPFRLDTANQCLWRVRDSAEHERIQLTPKAFGVLRHLVEHAGRLVSQDELLDAVWGHAHVEPAVLNNQILRLRHALGDHPRNPVFIETVSRRGYRFIASVHDALCDANLGNASLSPKVVGRRIVLDKLNQALSTALTGQRQIVFITGEPGIGKTTVLDEFQRQAAADVPGIRIARGQCVEGYGGGEAYYPMLEAVRQLCQGRGGDSLVRTLASCAPTWLVQFPALMTSEHRAMLQREILGATRERMLREIGEVLDVIASASPLLLVFEDLHWVDGSTVDLLSALARRRGPAKLLVLGTYRPADVATSNLPLKSLTQDLLVHHLCREIALEPLTEAEVAEYLAGGAPETPQVAALGALLYRRSEGNPLFMVAALEHLTERDLITGEHGGWHPKVALDEIDLGVPENLRRMIETRIERLSAEEQRVLEVASLHSVAPYRFGVAIRAPLIDMEPEAFEGLCGTLFRNQGIIRPATPVEFADGTLSVCYEFVHELYREVCYRRIGPGRRVRLHRLLAEQVEAHFMENSDNSAPRLASATCSVIAVLQCLELSDNSATWLAANFEQGEDWPRAVKYLRLAADRGRRRFAYGEAVATLQHAAELVSRIPERDRVICEMGVLEQLAACYVLIWKAESAVGIYRKMVALANRCGLIDAEIDALLDMSVPASWISTQLLIETVDRALRLSDSKEDPVARARIQVTCFAWRAISGCWRPQDAESCRNAVKQVEREGDPPAIAESRLQYGLVQWRASRYTEARRNLVESTAILLGQDDRAPLLAVRHHLGYGIQVVIRTLWLGGEWGQALKEITAATALFAKNEDPAEKAMLIKLGWIHLSAMDLAGVAAMCESMPASFVLGSTNRERNVLRGMAEAGLGNHDRALELLNTVRKDMECQPLTFDWYFKLPLQEALTELWLKKGDFFAARKEAESFLDAALATDERTYQGLAWEANARVAMALQDWKRAEQCVAKALTAIQGYDVPLAAWRVHGTASEVYARKGDASPAEEHQELSRATILRLANSLPPEEPLREIFLSAPMVRKILDRERTSKLVPQAVQA
jgi:DNA-binding winged helix-turn-helix (wHTH) protein/tetratricopeptide (TPR) repeat protein